MMDPEAPSYAVPDQYYLGIGRVAACWAYFELIVNHAIWELANVEQYVGACITGVFHQFRITADRTLEFNFTPVELTEIREVERKIRELIEETHGAIRRALTALPTFDRTQF